MKKIVVVLSILSLLFLTSCDGKSIIDYFPGNYFVGSGQRPADFPETKWVSKDPDIWFEVPKTANSSDFLYGELALSGENLCISLYFNPGRSVFIYDESTGKGRIITGLCTFYSDKLIVEIDKEFSDFFDGKYDTITFYKQGDKGKTEKGDTGDKGTVLLSPDSQSD